MHIDDKPVDGLNAATGLCGLHLYLAAQVQLLTNPSGIASYYDITRYEYYISTSNYQASGFAKSSALLGDVFDAGGRFSGEWERICHCAAQFCEQCHWNVHQVHCSLRVS
jgi:hypothetical protein